MALTPLEEQDALNNLVKSPGWLILLAHAKEEWGGAAYGRRIKLAISGALAELPALVKSIDYANDEINTLLSWPAKRLHDLTHPREPLATTTEHFNRGGR